MIVSNTTVTAWNTCKRQAYYGFIMGVEPILLPLPLYRGIAGHEAMAAYYRFNRDVTAAHRVIGNFVNELVRLDPENTKYMEALLHLDGLIDDYHKYYISDDFEVLEIEQEFRAPIGDDLSYAMKLDLLIRFNSGPYAGDLAIMDHKFVYNFKSPEEIALDAQLPKYIKTLQLQETPYTVTKGIFNQIRTRDMSKERNGPDNFFRRTYLHSNPIESNTIWEEQKDAAIEIYNWDGKPPRRTLNPIVCKGCSFQRLCKKELTGEPIDNMLKYEFKPSTYGYAEAE